MSICNGKLRIISSKQYILKIFGIIWPNPFNIYNVNIMEKFWKVVILLALENRDPTKEKKTKNRESYSIIKPALYFSFLSKK